MVKGKEAFKCDDHRPQIQQAVATSTAEAHGLTQALADAIEEALMHANCAHTLDEDDEPLPIVDKLSAPGADTIETGRNEVWLLRDAVLSAVEQVLRERQVFKTQPKGTEDEPTDDEVVSMFLPRPHALDAEGERQSFIQHRKQRAGSEPSWIPVRPLPGRFVSEVDNEAWHAWRARAALQAPAVAHTLPHPKQIAGVGCALCGKNEAGYYCTGDCGEYQEAASHPPVKHREQP